MKGARRAVTLVLLGALASAGPTTAGPVEELRGLLKSPGAAPESRGHDLRRWDAQPHSLLDLSEALLLTEWRVTDADERIARIDRECRAAQFRAFETGVRDVLANGPPCDRVAVIELLGNIGIRATEADFCHRLGTAFGPCLASLLQEANPAIRQSALRSLGKIAPPLDIALPVLAAQMESPDVVMRLGSAQALGELFRLSVERSKPGSAVPAAITPRADSVEVGRAVAVVLEKGLHDTHPHVRRMSLFVLKSVAQTVAGRLCPDLATGTRPSSERSLDEFLITLAERVPAIVGDLSDGDADMQLLAIQTMVELGALRAKALERSAPMSSKEDRLGAALCHEFARVYPCLANPDVRMRLATIQVLEELGPLAAPYVAVLAHALGDPDRFVRWSAVRALGKVGPPAAGALPALAQVLNDTDVDVRLACVAALEALGPSARPAIPALVTATERQVTAEVRLAALRALEKIGDRDSPSIAAVMQRALSDADDRVRHLAAIQIEARGVADGAVGRLRGPVRRPDDGGGALTRDKPRERVEPTLVERQLRADIP